MGEINRALGAAGAGATLKVGGDEYPLSPLTKRVQGQYEAWLESRARAAVRPEKEFLEAEIYAALLARLSDEILRGKYSFTGPLAQETLRTLDGVTHLLYLLLLPGNPKATKADAERFVDECGAEVACAIKELTDLGKRQRSKPTATAN